MWIQSECKLFYEGNLSGFLIGFFCLLSASKYSEDQGKKKKSSRLRVKKINELKEKGIDKIKLFKGHIHFILKINQAFKFPRNIIVNTKHLKSVISILITFSRFVL